MKAMAATITIAQASCSMRSLRNRTTFGSALIITGLPARIMATLISARSTYKGLPKTKLSQYGKLCQEKKAWRDKSGTDRGSQSASVEHGQGTQGERTADVYGADGASARRRRPEASRTRTGLESCHYSQREA